MMDRHHCTAPHHDAGRHGAPQSGRKPHGESSRHHHSGRSGAVDDRAQSARQGPPLLTCFLVEDSPVIRQNLISTLEEMLPVEVVATAEDEAEAVAWMRRSDTQCDLMIIDIFLRSGTGLEVLRQARKLKPQARLVVLTNYATADMRGRCLQLGADSVFDKSAEVDELIAFGEQLANARLN